MTSLLGVNPRGKCWCVRIREDSAETRAAPLDRQSHGGWLNTARASADALNMHMPAVTPCGS